MTTEFPITIGSDMVSYETVTFTNRWNELEFNVEEKLETNNLRLMVGGVVGGSYVYCDAYVAKETLYETCVEDVLVHPWRSAAHALAKDLSDHGDSWFIDHWNWFDVKCLVKAQIEHRLKPPPAYKPLPGSAYKPISPKKTQNFEDSVIKFADMIPGISEMVACPEGCGKSPLYMLIQHINDGHLWDREEIADWLDTLPIDLTVKVDDGCQ